MWMAEPAAGGLRQGDLVSNIVLPRIALPLRFVLTSGGTPTAGTQALVDSSSVTEFIVVTQCCSIENQKTVALAPIRRQRMQPDQDRSLYSECDPSATDEPIVSNLHLLEAVATLPEEDAGLINVADLAQIISVGGDRSVLETARIASMTAAGRRLLRMRLANFWGRVEAEDLEWFVEQGKPPGPSRPV